MCLKTNMHACKLLVFFGGCSSEYAVSLQSACAVLQTLDPARYAPVPVGITRDGAWLYYTGPIEAVAADTWHKDAAHCTPCTLDLTRGARALWLADGGRVAFDAAFPILHGKNGEDGTLQGALELAGVPLVGCGCLAGALCMDKHRAHLLAAVAGVTVPRGQTFYKGADPAALRAAADAIGWPVFVKPVRAGSSFGISCAKDPAELEQAVAEAFRYDDVILLEQAIPGSEVGCAVLGNAAGDLVTGEPDLIQLAPGEAMFDYGEKYTLAHSAIHCPAPVPAETARRIRQTAQTVYRALDCRGFARVDLFLTPDGDLVFNEVNTIPGLTAHSRLPGMMKAAGMGFSALLDRVIELGVQG